MHFCRLYANFGTLQNQTLELQDGLNIIQAPNETGKSTWCAFLLSMLYGINSRERDRSDFIADKNRYLPWDGSAMSGRLELADGRQAYTLTRATKRAAAPMGDFQAVYTGTADPVPELSGSTCGDMLLGVSRRVYERSAFIRQGGLAIGQDADLERRIAALISSGEEDTSYSEAADVLKKQLNRRRHNKTGRIPELEGELTELRRQLGELNTLSDQLRETRIREETLSHREALLAEELSLHDRWAAHLRRQAVREAEATAYQAAARVEMLRHQLEDERIPSMESINRLRGAIVNLESTRQSLKRANAQKAEAQEQQQLTGAAAQATPFAGQTEQQARSAQPAISPKPRFPLWSILPAAGIGAGTGFLLSNALQQTLPVSLGAGLLAAALVLLGFALKLDMRRKAWEADTAERRRLYDEQLEAYLLLYRAAEAARADAAVKAAAADALQKTIDANEAAILLEIRRFAPAAFDVSGADALLRDCAARRKELADAESAARDAGMRWNLLAQQAPELCSEGPLSPPPRAREEVEAELTQTRVALAAARSDADRLTGRLHALGDPAEPAAAAAQHEEELSRLQGEYDALNLALSTLDRANASLQNRFSPELGRRAAEIFSFLSEDRYSGVVLDRDFRLSAHPRGDALDRTVQLLSAGAADQLYLATRLAVCDLVLPADRALPIVLDDALASFDDDRCAAALRCLKDLSRKRQVLLFTCHSREAAFFSGDSEVSIQRLTRGACQV